MPVLKLAIFGVVVLVVGAVVISMPDGEKSVLKDLEKAGIETTEHTFMYRDTFEVKSRSLGNTDGAKVVFIHGSPGDWTAHSKVFSDSILLKNYHMISIDRAGYGGTTVPAQSDLKIHGEVAWAGIAPHLKPGEKIIVVGHSYGGAVVEQLLLDHPDAIAKAVMVAPTVSPEHQKPRWYNKVARSRVISWMIGKSMRSSNVEMLGLPLSLEANENDLKNIQTPIIYIQGLKDVLVDPVSVDYFKEHVTAQTDFVIVEDMNHFTPWSHPHLIIEAIQAN